ncbi:helix-turn-helix transcriptional regulator [Gracilibacillus dipsosauri]|nr:AraC family transcriptional regulator [Gracilibacillus dipsosauri]
MSSLQDMKPLEELFPYSFVYKNSKAPQNERPDHMHHFHEIIYVHNGNGVFFIDNTLYEMSKGDIFIIPNDTLHHARPDKHNLITSSVIFFSSGLIYPISIDDSFSYLSLIEKVKKEKEFKIQIPIKEQPILEQYLLQIHHELTEDKLGSIHASLLITHQILLHLSRMKLKNKDELIHAKTSPHDWMNYILAYIEKNLEQNLSLPALAKEALVSPAHFSRIFKQITGMGPIAYINKKRILKSKELLLQSSLTITVIAEMMGYDSTPHFYRTFKKYVGMTPAQFRKKERNA